MNIKEGLSSSLEDVKGDEAWRMFRVLSEFTEGYDKLSDIDFELIKITDDIDEVVEIMSAHRKWKKAQIAAAKK